MIKATTYRSGITYSLLFNAFSKGLVLVSNLLIAYFFGVNSGTDLYFYLFSCVLLCANFVIGMNGAVVIPESKRLEEVHGRSASHGFVNRVFYLLVLVLGLTCAAVFLCPVPIISLISNFSEADLVAHMPIIYLSAVLLLIQIVVLFLNDLLTYYRYFVLPGAISLTNAVLTIVFIFFLHERLGLQSMLLASIVAYSISFVTQIFILRRFEHWNFFTLNFSGNRETLYNAFYSVMSIIISILVSFLPLYLLSRYAAGSISSLVFAQRISEIPNTLLAIQFATVVGVSLTEKHLQKQHDDFNDVFVRSAGVLFFLMIPIAVCIFFLSEDLIAVLFEHGALKQGYSNQISQVLSFLIIGVPFTGVNYLTAKVLIASQRFRESFVYNFIMGGVHILLIFAGIHQAAQIGYAAAFSTYCILCFLFYYFMLRRALPFIQYGKIVRSFLVFLLINVALMGVITAVVSYVIPEQLHLFKLMAAGGVYVGGLLIVNHYTSISPDIRDTVLRVLSYISLRRKNGQ